MIVLDASAVIELVVGTQRGRQVASRISDPKLSLHAPHLLDLEVVHVLRRYERSRDLSSAEAGEALRNFQQLDIERHAHEPYVQRIWSLRRNNTAYDAMYLALAEVLDATLVTCDAKLFRSRSGLKIQLIS